MFILTFKLTLGDDTQALSSVQKWAVEFTSRRESIEDDRRCSRLASATTEENSGRIHFIVMDDR